MVRSAFLDLHGPRLHGFALLVTLGDRSRAAALTTQALGAGLARVGELRHPERAAAWLRAQVARAVPRGPRTPAPDAPRVLGRLGVDGAAFAGLAALDPRERAGVVAAVVEGIDLRDVATIVGRDGSDLDRFLGRARRRYLAAAAESSDLPPAGLIADRLRDVATRTLR